ncbi:winged helix-turn-helix transcriptional regulator [Haloactinospora alba]|uniref:winged helix-turn-helix transcriptional regulator n=1 Tax=Haloactinospora alba TaxID=405555 RepID=UPI00319E10E3
MAKKSPYNCGLDAAVDVVGGKWKPLLLWKLSVGPCRFGELRREFPAISEKMLIQQLRAMEGDGLVHRELYYQVPPRVEYSLTELGGVTQRCAETPRGLGRAPHGAHRRGTPRSYLTPAGHGARKAGKRGGGAGPEEGRCPLLRSAAHVPPSHAGARAQGAARPPGVAAGHAAARVRACAAAGRPSAW